MIAWCGVPVPDEVPTDSNKRPAFAKAAEDRSKGRRVFPGKRPYAENAGLVSAFQFSL